MDAEDFQIWKESTATQWVLKRVQERSDSVKAKLAEQLYHSTNLTPAEWAAIQSRAGFDRGLATGMETVCNLEFEDIDDSEPPSVG